ncbi:tetratricopeptide repeat protein [Rhodopseudomonas sp. B29]|uniref:tetratricopeptide repeat protein n=1 Tax=Rhodopseudomonas sp. B29 TaxID=95607 RepID=UPI0003B33707|nr:tetratricopeptide repeat protein [Rhodopseudomonas sp. B29]
MQARSFNKISDRQSPFASTVLPKPQLHIQARRVTETQLRDLLRENPQDAVRWIEAAAEADLVPAQLVWGQMLLDGKRVPRNPQAAFTWFERAALSGDLEGRNMVGRCYEQGWGVEPNSQLAIENFEAAALAGHLWGQVNLAQMLMRRGNPADRPRCFELFRAAAEGGTAKANLKAMNSLARFLEEGWATPVDQTGALYWYRRAAELGDHWAQFNLATILHATGDLGAADVLLEQSIARSDDGFRRRVAALLLARSEPALRRHGLEALRRVSLSGRPADVKAYAEAAKYAVSSSETDDATDRLQHLAVEEPASDAAYQPASADRSITSSLAFYLSAISRRLGKPFHINSSSSEGAL